MTSPERAILHSSDFPEDGRASDPYVRITEDDRRERDAALLTGLATRESREALARSYIEKMGSYHRPLSPEVFGLIFENLNTGKRLLKCCQESKDSPRLCKQIVSAILRLEREMDLDLGFQIDP